MKINNTDLKIGTEKAFSSIFLKATGIKIVAENPRTRISLEVFGINPDNFTPEIAPEISVEQWIRILRFYSERIKYQPARDILTGLKKIIRRKY